jgi:hypothetical protein
MEAKVLESGASDEALPREPNTITACLENAFTRPSLKASQRCDRSARQSNVSWLSGFGQGGVSDPLL